LCLCFLVCGLPCVLFIRAFFVPLRRLSGPPEGVVPSGLMPVQNNRSLHPPAFPPFFFLLARRVFGIRFVRGRHSSFRVFIVCSMVEPVLVSGGFSVPLEVLLYPRLFVFFGWFFCRGFFPLSAATSLVVSPSLPLNQHLARSIMNGWYDPRFPLFYSCTDVPSSRGFLFYSYDPVRVTFAEHHYFVSPNPPSLTSFVCCQPPPFL